MPLLHRIVSTPAEGMTSKYSFSGKKQTFPEPVFFNRFQGILGTARIKTTYRGKGLPYALIQPDCLYRHSFHQCYLPGTRYSRRLPCISRFSIAST